MLALFLRSLRLHFAWWFHSLWPGTHPGSPLGWRRLFFLILLYPLFLAGQFIHWLGFLLDELFFPGYRQIQIRAPVFVTGIPRSGTTFVHRTLEADPRFTSLSTWEALLAPSVTQRKCIRALARVDRALGAPVKRLIDRVVRQGSGDFNDVHEIRLDAPEEDYLVLLPAGACFILLLAFPFTEPLRQLGRLDRMPDAPRRRLLGFYRRCLQKHLYCAPPKTRLLSKNAAFGSWAQSLAETFPDAKFILCVREPLSALSSQLSSIDGARRFFGCEPLEALFVDLFAQNYQSLAHFLGTAAPASATVIDQHDLKTDPGALLRQALARIEVTPAPELDRELGRLRPATPSGHRHSAKDFELDRSQIEVCIQPAYAQILDSPQRASLPAK